jgi:serine/threonine protein kinase
MGRMGDDLGTADTDMANLPAAAPATATGRFKLAPGARVGGYVIESHCGAGGMGTVYRARDPLLGRPVAIKLVNAERSGAGRCGVLCSLLVREAQTLAKLSHPSLVAVHGIGEHEGCVYVAMEYVDGTTLSTWVRGKRWTDRFAALAAAARGLAAAHAAHVVHRDFKPDNVMVTKRGDVKVMDFGLARGVRDFQDVAPVGACAACAPAEQVAEVEDLRAAVGTPPYMAPELFEGVAADARSDQYAFAVSCWEVAYGVWPFRGETPGELYFAKKQGEPAGASPREVPAAVEALLRRALLPAPSRRYPSLSDLIERLEVAAGG